MAEHLPFLLSAGGPEELRRLAARHLSALEDPAGAVEAAGSPSAVLRDLATALSLAPPQEYRAALIASSFGELRERLAAIRDAEGTMPRTLGPSGIGMARADHDSSPLLLFPGQGSQRPGENAWLARGSEAYAEHVRELEGRFGDDALGTRLSEAWTASEDNRRSLETGCRETSIAQPLLSVTALAMVRTLEEAGVPADAVLGHSVGEFGALRAAGVLGETEILDLVRRRVECTRSLAPGSSMLAVRNGTEGLPASAEPPEGLFLACDNDPSQTVLGGPAAAVGEAARELTRRGVACTPLRTSSAFHTPVMAEADRAFGAALASLDAADLPTPEGIRLYSSISGSRVRSRREALDLLSRQLSTTVRFREACLAAQEASPDFLVQVSGGTSLIEMYRRTNPGFTGPHAGFGGSDPQAAEHARAVATLFLSVRSFRPHVLIGGLGVASRAPHAASTAESVLLARASADASAPAPAHRPHRPAESESEPMTHRPQPNRPSSRQAAPATGAEAAGRSSLPEHGAPPEGAASAGSTALALTAALMHDQMRTLRWILGAEKEATPALPHDARRRDDASHPAPDGGRNTGHGGREREDAVNSDSVPDAGAMRTPPDAPVPPTPDSASAPGSDPEDLGETIRRIVAEVGGYAPEQIFPADELGADLGLDSLMLTGILATLAERFPGWRPTSLDPSRITTVQDLVKVVGEGKDGSATTPDPHSAAPEPAAGTASPDPTEAPAEAGAPGKDTAASRDDAVAVDPRPLWQTEEVSRTGRRLEQAARGTAPLPYYLEHEGVADATTSIGGEEYISFGSYNYLGLTGHPSVVRAAQEAVSRYGTSCSAARILSGNRPLHTQLETSISRLVGTEDAAVLVSGHGTNMSVIPHLYGPQDIVFHDALAHDSILQGIRASGAARHSFPHNRTDLLERALRSRRRSFRRALIVTEGIFSMDGDVADLPELVRLAKEHGAHLMVDEAHSIGVLGARGGGICEELGVDPHDVDLLMGTLSKSLASCGGYIAGHSALVQHLRFSLSGLVFSAAITPPNAASALAALEMIEQEPGRLRTLRENSRHFLDGARARGLEVGDAIGAAVVPVIIGDSGRTIEVSRGLHDAGISVNPIVFPAVAENLSRLRFFITQDHTREQLDAALDATADLLSRPGGGAPAPGTELRPSTASPTPGLPEGEHSAACGAGR
ncbi:aminotransferase class I/II-fold pyridoxal phosphate-dependent enzyme [Rothia halotolerans]|uniref:aminotransferase class I/II-fold pyridoxal phosphate-dependent enzyme n=1 Tax=Rothia halotolerans TaxID=405770 RepID=UPI00101D53B2|nr:aminotransferase class I/II-fold pyridoxal phosphate-dependent enzyme [Rothia halotolerans]